MFWRSPWQYYTIAINFVATTWLVSLSNNRAPTTKCCDVASAVCTKLVYNRSHMVKLVDIKSKVYWICEELERCRPIVQCNAYTLLQIELLHKKFNWNVVDLNIGLCSRCHTGNMFWDAALKDILKRSKDHMWVTRQNHRHPFIIP